MEAVKTLISTTKDIVFEVAGEALSFAVEQPLIAIPVGLAIVTGLVFTGLGMIKH